METELERGMFDAFRQAFNPSRARSFRNPVSSGVSDGREGVQWSLYVTRSGNETVLGVNLEGLKYDGWPIARLIERELEKPGIPPAIGPDRNSTSLHLWLWRDLWGAGGGRTHEAILDLPMCRLDKDVWRTGLEEAYRCLDSVRGHRGRARRDGRWVSPHLHISCTLWQEHAPPVEAQISLLNEGRGTLQCFHDWATERSRA
jgi:hypothetical protein